MEKIINVYKFLNDIEKLKSTTRHSWTSTGRHESVAEHAWRLSMMALVLEEDFSNLNINRIIQMCLVHDLGEIYAGDIPAFEKTVADELTEANDIKRVVRGSQKISALSLAS